MDKKKLGLSIAALAALALSSGCLGGGSRVRYRSDYQRGYYPSRPYAPDINQRRVIRQRQVRRHYQFRELERQRDWHRRDFRYAPRRDFRQRDFHRPQRRHRR